MQGRDDPAGGLCRQFTHSGWIRHEHDKEGAGLTSIIGSYYLLHLAIVVAHQRIHCCLEKQPAVLHLVSNHLQLDGHWESDLEAPPDVLDDVIST